VNTLFYKRSILGRYQHCRLCVMEWYNVWWLARIRKEAIMTWTRYISEAGWKQRKNTKIFILQNRFPGKGLKETPSDYKSRATTTCLVTRCWSCGFHDRELRPAEELSNV